MIGRGGIAAVDHRTVAAEAGVPLGSTTYYFESKADMVSQTLNYVADLEAERLARERERLATQIRARTKELLETNQLLLKTQKELLAYKKGLVV